MGNVRDSVNMKAGSIVVANFDKGKLSAQRSGV